VPEVDSVYCLARRMDRSLAGQRVLHSSPVAYDGHGCGAARPRAWWPRSRLTRGDVVPGGVPLLASPGPPWPQRYPGCGASVDCVGHARKCRCRL